MTNYTSDTSSIFVKRALLLFFIVLLTLFPQFCYSTNNTTNVTTTAPSYNDEFVIQIWYLLANCSSIPGNVSVGILYCERKNLSASNTLSSIFDYPNLSIKKLDLSIDKEVSRLCKWNKNNGIWRCRYSYSVSGEDDYDRLRKFVFRLLTPSFISNDYTCCWSFDKFRVLRRLNETHKSPNILPFRRNKHCINQPSLPSCVYNNTEWVCPRNNNETVFESGIFTANYSSDYVSYTNPENCSNHQHQSSSNLTKCAFITNGPSSVTTSSNPINIQQTASHSSSSLSSFSEPLSSVIEPSSSTNHQPISQVEERLTSISTNGVSRCQSMSVMMQTLTVHSMVDVDGETTAHSSSSSFSLPVPTPPTTTTTTTDKVLVCESEGGIWPQSSAGTNVTLPTGVKECYNGTVEAIRFCYPGGNWSDVHCIVSPLFSETFSQIIAAPVEGLIALSMVTIELPLSQYVLLLDKAIESASLKVLDNIDKDKFIQNFLKISNSLILSLSEDISEESEDQRRAVSQLLQSLDNFALTFIEPSGKILEFDGSFLKVTQVEPMSVTTSDGVNGIQVGSNSITLPNIIFRDVSVPVRIASFFFPNLSDLLPPVDTNSSIISPIISATIDCDSCIVNDLTENVKIDLKIAKNLNSSTKKQVSCVFYDFRSQNGLLANGDWNTSGCTTVSVNGDIVTCSCNHLTHFAILLSPGGPEISSIHYHVLNTMGLVLVPISLLCMVLVILTYTLIRSLWSIRNYIHIMLCGSLFMAQLVFIIGVDKIENQGVCSAVAVILLYLFLVTFMWMLMEGVVLYVTLVRVFIENHLYYIIAFTVTSYIIPAIYMAIVTPIGFLINTEGVTHNTHFLYYRNEGNHSSLSACWLNYSTGFIWSFIAPVTLIIMINIGFFIMSIVILRKHTIRHKKKFTVKIQHWLKALISLTLVMGIAWLVGVMAFRKELLPVVYIITIFIASQGILIFIILVPMSKQVREAYVKVWHTEKSQSRWLSRIADYTFFGSNSLNRTGKVNRPDKVRSINREGMKNPNGSVRSRGIVLGMFGAPEIENSVPKDTSVSNLRMILPQSIPLSQESSSFDSVDKVNLANYTVTENIHICSHTCGIRTRPQYETEPNADNESKTDMPE